MGGKGYSQQPTFGHSASRKKIIIGVAVGVVVLAIVLGVAIGVPLSKRAAKDPNLAKAEQILSEVPLIDG